VSQAQDESPAGGGGCILTCNLLGSITIGPFNAAKRPVKAELKYIYFITSNPSNLAVGDAALKITTVCLFFFKTDCVNILDLC